MLGDNIRRIRQNHHLTQSAFGDILHVTQGAVSQWEKGQTRPDTDQLIAISQAFHVSIDELTEDVPVPSFKEMQLHPAEAPLSENEEKLILDYRKLTPKGKNRLRMILDEYIVIYGCPYQLYEENNLV